MCHLIVLACFAVPLPAVHQSSAEASKPMTGPWDLEALQTAAVKPEWGEVAGRSREVYYHGEPLVGKPTRVFAWYSKPAGDGPFPAVLLVHGGGGKAFRAWAEHWSARGYCALAMDLAGNGPKGRSPDGGPDQSDDVKFRDFTDAEVKDMWTYHAVAAVLRGHTLLASLPEVDRKRIAVTGISWGGYLTCIVAGLDDRLKAAVPVYGCGFLHENSFWKEPRFDRMPAALRERWVKNFDPSRYLPGVKCPILFLNGTNDFAYPLDSYKKSYGLVRAPWNLSVRVLLKHGHIWTFGEVDAFIDSHLKRGDPLPRLGAMSREGSTVSAAFELEGRGKGTPRAGQLHYAVATGPWQKRTWQSAPAEIKDGRVTAKLPEDRPLVYYLAVTDSRGLEVSAPHEVLAAEKSGAGDK
jgi:dienelactone hydrolase